MLKKMTAIQGTVVLLAWMAGAQAAAAGQVPARELLLPSFEVDLEGGVDTTFSVVNSGDLPVRVKATVYTNWGIAALHASFDLGAGAIETVSLGEWLRHGELPEKTLAPTELEHCQAILSGQPSPVDELYYSTATDFQVASGWVRIRVDGFRRPAVLFGDYFVVDPDAERAQGNDLVNLDRRTADDGFCRRHGLRFLQGGVLDPETEVVVWTPQRRQPSEGPDTAPAEQAMTTVSAFTKGGRLLEERPRPSLPLEVVKVGDLDLETSSGWLDLSTERDSFVVVRHSAGRGLGVGLGSTCLPLPPAKSSRVAIEKTILGVDADEAPGPIFFVGDRVTWTYLVTNTGDTPLYDLAVVDDREGAIACPERSLDPGSTMTCTLTVVEERGGQHESAGTVVASSPGGERVTDTDPAYWHTLDPPLQAPIP